MALLLKSTRLLYKAFRLPLQPKLTRHNNVNFPKQWNNCAALDVFLRKAHTAPKIMNADILNKSLYQLELDMKYKNKIYKQDFDNLLKSLEHWGNITYPQSLLLIMCCGSLSFIDSCEGRLQRCRRVWNMLEKSGLNLDIAHYNALLSVYLENEHEFSPHDFLNDLMKKNITPNFLTYQRLLRAFCLKGDIVSASNLLETMKEKDFPLNEFIFNSLIYCHSRIGDVESAQGIMDLMKEKGIQPSSETYSNLLCGLAKKGDIEKLKEVMEKCQNEGLLIMDKDVLEIVYILATSGQVEEANNLVKKVKKQLGYEKYVPQLILRLLEKKLDNIALDIFFTLECREDRESREVSSFLVQYYLKRRTVEELLDLFKVLQEKGYSSGPLNYALKIFITEESPRKCYDFFIQLRRTHFLRIRPHYFWPLIIRAKKEGNMEILYVLAKMKNLGVPRCFETVTRVLVPNYNFKKDWQADIDHLEEYGVDRRFLCLEMCRQFLRNNDIASAEAIAKTNPMERPLLNLRSVLEGNLKAHPENAKAIVNIIYYCAHDRIYQSPAAEVEVEGEENERESQADEREPQGVDINLEGDIVKKINVMLHSLVDILLHNSPTSLPTFLEALLEKKIPLSEHLASTLLSSPEGTNLEHLVKKLREINSFEYDEELLGKKKTMTQIMFSEIRKLCMKGDPKGEELWEREGRPMVFCDIVGLVCLHKKNENLDKAMEYFRMLPMTPDKDASVLANEQIIRRFLIALKQAGKIDYLEEALDIAIEIKHLKPGNYGILIRSYLERNNIEAAVDVFCNKCCKARNFGLYGMICEVLVLQENSELLKKVTTEVGNIVGERASLTMLLFEFLKKRFDTQAKKLIETPGWVLCGATFRRKIGELVNLELADSLEALLDITKNTLGIDRTSVYQGLLNLYIKREEVDEVEKLWCRAQEEGIPLNNAFISTMFLFLKSMKKTPPFNLTSGKSLGDETPKEGGFDDLKRACGFLDKGDIKSAAKLLSDKSKNLILPVILYIVENNMFDQYLNLLKSVKELNKDQALKFSAAFPNIEDIPSRDKFFKEYKRIAMDFFMNDMLVKPLVCYWLLCLKARDRPEEVDEVYNLLFSESTTNWSVNNLHRAVRHYDEFYPDVLQYSKSKGNDRLTAQCYKMLIKRNVSKHNMNEALSLANQAMKENISDFIDDESLQVLKNYARQEGISFSALKQNDSPQDANRVADSA